MPGDRVPYLRFEDGVRVAASRGEGWVIPGVCRTWEASTAAELANDRRGVMRDPSGVGKPDAFL